MTLPTTAAATVPAAGEQTWAASANSRGFERSGPEKPRKQTLPRFIQNAKSVLLFLTLILVHGQRTSDESHPQKTRQGGGDAETPTHTQRCKVVTEEIHTFHIAQFFFSFFFFESA